MLAVLHSIEMFVVDLFKSRCQLEAKNLILHTSIRQETAALHDSLWVRSGHSVITEPCPLSSKADIASLRRYVRFVANSDRAHRSKK